MAVSDFEKRMSEVLYISLCVSVLSVCPPCLCLRGLRLCPCPSWLMSCGAGLRKFIGLPAMVRGKTSCGPRCGLRRARHILLGRAGAPDCCNPVTSRRVWSRIAAILSLPEEFGSGLLQSCRFPKSLAPDCCNPAASRSVWLRIAAILSLPEVSGSGLPQSCVSGNVRGRLSRNPAFSSPELPGFREIQEKTAGNGRCFEKRPFLQAVGRRACRLRRHRRQSRRHRWWRQQRNSDGSGRQYGAAVLFPGSE